METHFAIAERLDEAALREELAFVGANPVVSALLQSVAGLLAVLNTHRQILAVNETLLELLGLESAGDVLGLRPGEALGCVHAREMPGGCGTSGFCSSCGAAIAIVASLAADAPVERECAIAAEDGGRGRDLYFRVRCVPVGYGGRRLLLLFLQDITYQQRLAALERLFFHDISGTINGLVGATYLLSQRAPEQVRELSASLSALSLRLATEVTVQRCLNDGAAAGYQPTFTPVAARQVLREIREIFRTRPLVAGRRLVVQEGGADVVLRTEPSLLTRVLANMVTNALEATPEGGEVKVWHEETGGSVAFLVWNGEPIPPEVAKRVFQRNFSTKAEMGRGLGTYSMKMFGEDILGGRVSFTSSAALGTIFSIRLPK
jgi:signal transduction histidine kinase